MVAGSVPSGQPLGFYLHVPFCVQRCHYCSFNTAPLEAGQMDPYLRALHGELDLLGALDWARDVSLATVFLGGGTPSLLEPEALAAVLEHLRERWRSTAAARGAPAAWTACPGRTRSSRSTGPSSAPPPPAASSTTRSPTTPGRVAAHATTSATGAPPSTSRPGPAAAGSWATCATATSSRSRAGAPPSRRARCPSRPPSASLPASARPSA